MSNSIKQTNHVINNPYIVTKVRVVYIMYIQYKDFIDCTTVTFVMMIL